MSTVEVFTPNRRSKRHEQQRVSATIIILPVMRVERFDRKKVLPPLTEREKQRKMATWEKNLRKKRLQRKMRRLKKEATLAAESCLPTNMVLPCDC